jgi:hypothetical protein
MRFAPFLLLFLSIATTAQAGDLPAYTGNERGIPQMLETAEHWAPEDIQSQELTLSPEPGRRFKVYFSKASCGTGLCHQYIFQRSTKTAWRLIGKIPGPVVLSEKLDHGLRMLTSSRTNTSFAFDGTKYGPLP